jgi:hypothetical protein
LSNKLSGLTLSDINYFEIHVGAPDSALSLRVFFEDLTAAGRQTAAWKQRKDNLNENVAPETPVPETPTPDLGFEGLEPKDGDEEDGFAMSMTD